MDEFAQTRAPDDLFFDDDYTPLPAPTPQIYETEQTPPLELQNNRSASPSKESEVQPPDQPPAPVLTNSPTPTSPPTARSTNVIAQSPTAPRIAPVRGDRHLTGGLVKPKLTEEELSSKLAAAKLNSAKRAEAHRLAEADEADFHAREAKVQVRRQEEGKARRVMDMERERNRIRKLGAQGEENGMKGRRR
ncbi:uncharacterized protein KY384_002693 [Bacidia gigantensis]|uniref:uncharacterized protein n=1 Tax=Bacidia gigantensis TaxID=2732470 RepID=UPI001D047D53|nr:uncharacterized protein KY384_002693 [Bacidia gigantensis]KAG8532815.1 hypothetical protein KY384_002693 [Bacidia gigantensis]